MIRNIYHSFVTDIMTTQLSSNPPHVLERRGSPLHYWLTGAIDAPLLVLTHGATADHHLFDRQLSILTDRYRVLTWDMRGHGQSRPMGSPFTVAGAVEDLVAILDEVGEKQAIFAGQSTGGYVAQELVFRHPERVRALVIIDSICITFRLPPWERFLLRLTPALLRWYPRDLLIRQSAESSTVTQQGYDYLQRTMNALPKADWVAIFAGVANSLHYEAEYQITHPLLLVHGDADNLGNIKKDAPRWAERDPNCTYRVIPDAGHISNMDNPAFFNRVLLEFLESLEGRM
jgi:3-oxoadipate enol-lactonase